MHTGVKIRGNKAHYTAESAGTMIENLVLRRGSIDANGDTDPFLILDADGNTVIGYSEAGDEDGILFDANGGLWRFAGNTRSLSEKAGLPIKMEGTNDIYLGFAGIAAPQAITNSGDANDEIYCTHWTMTVGSPQLNMGDGRQAGQIKKVKCVAFSGATHGIFKPSNFSYPPNPALNTIRMEAVGDYAIVMWDGTNWLPVELGNDTDGATAPTIVFTA